MASKGMTKEQRDILTRVGMFVVLIAVVSVIAFYLSGVVEDLEKKHTYLKNDISEMNRKLEGFNKKTLEFSEGVKVWETLSEADKELPGLRINDAKDVLDKLQKKYLLTSVKTSFSKPEELAGDYKSDTVNVVSSIISISFSALSDEYVYNFIEDITKTFPGFVQIKSISLSKPSPVTKEILKKISMGEEVGIVNITIDFYWQDLKYKGVSTGAPTAEAGGAKK